MVIALTTFINISASKWQPKNLKVTIVPLQIMKRKGGAGIIISSYYFNKVFTIKWLSFSSALTASRAQFFKYKSENITRHQLFMPISFNADTGVTLRKENITIRRTLFRLPKL